MTRRINRGRPRQGDMPLRQTGDRFEAAGPTTPERSPIPISPRITEVVRPTHAGYVIGGQRPPSSSDKKA